MILSDKSFLKEVTKQKEKKEKNEKYLKQEKIKNFFKKFLIFYLTNVFTLKSQDFNIQEKDNILKFEKDKIEEVEDKQIKIIKKEINWGYKEYKEEKDRDIKLIVIHSVYYPYDEKHKYDLDKILDLFKKYNVASHYIIDRKGNIFQLVSDKDIAYHVGKTRNKNKENNENSLGIELINDKKEKITPYQYQSLKKLVLFLKEKYNIEKILGHKDVVKERKSDPWNFNLKQFLKDLEN